jgi:hypothetical protein
MQVAPMSQIGPNVILEIILMQGLLQAKWFSTSKKKIIKEEIKQLGIYKNDFHSQTLKP